MERKNSSKGRKNSSKGRKNSSKGGKKEECEDGSGWIFRMITSDILEKEKIENPACFSFVEVEDDTEILEKLRRKFGTRREGGSSSNSNVNDPKRIRTHRRLRKAMSEYLENKHEQHPQLCSSLEEERVNLEMMRREDEEDTDDDDDDDSREQVPQSKWQDLLDVVDFELELYDRKKTLLEKQKNVVDTHEQQQSHAPHELPTVFQEKRANLEMMTREDEKDTDDDDFRKKVPQSKWEDLLDVADFELELYDRKKTYLEKQKNVVDTHVRQQSHAPHELPKMFQEKIQELKGDEVKLLMQKKLSESDLNDESFSVRLRLIAINFLTQEEQSHLDGRFDMHVSVLDPSLRTCEMCFKKFLMNENYVYNFSKGWNMIVLDNHLKLHDNLQLWSFRVSSKLWFALVKLS